MQEEKRYTEGHFIGIGIAIGMSLGVAIGLAIGMIALGPALGLPIGLTGGIIAEKKLNPNPIKLSPEQKSKRRILLASTLGVGILAFVATLAFYLHLV